MLKCTEVKELIRPSRKDTSTYRDEILRMKDELNYIKENFPLSVRMHNLYQVCADEMIHLGIIGDEMSRCESTFSQSKVLDEKRKIKKLGNKVYKMCSDRRYGVNLWSPQGRSYRFNAIGANRKMKRAFDESIMDRLYPRPTWFSE